MLVNEIAKCAGVEAHVVRYYSRIGLLKPRRNPDNGYQVFGRDDLQRLAWLQELQALGFLLSEIRQFLEEAPDCQRVRAGLELNIARNRRKLAELTALQERMETALAHFGGEDCRNPLCGGCCERASSAQDADRPEPAFLDLYAAHSP